MGLEYYAIKTRKPHAWYMGKDYYGLSDLFPPCQYKRRGLFANMFTPSISDLPYIVGSRHIVGPTPFVVTKLYPYIEDMMDRAEHIKNTNYEGWQLQNLNDFFNWAQDDEIFFVPDFDDIRNGTDRDISEYPFLTKPQNYCVMGS
jgi:hypothetical protein